MRGQLDSEMMPPAGAAGPARAGGLTDCHCQSGERQTWASDRKVGRWLPVGYSGGHAPGRATAARIAARAGAQSRMLLCQCQCPLSGSIGPACQGPCSAGGQRASAPH